MPRQCPRYRIATAILFAVLLFTVGLWAAACGQALNRDSLEFAEVHVYDWQKRSTVVMAIDLEDPHQLEELESAWKSVAATRHIDHAPGSDYDATLKVQFKDGRVVLIAWRQSWSQLRPTTSSAGCTELMSSPSMLRARHQRKWSGI
jgi:sucrose-6-phosphate hydrolase SacC (GH32 family)